jgi:hypothetical protein
MSEKPLTEQQRMFTAEPGKVLVYGNRKSEQILVDVSTPNLMDLTIFWLFNYLRTEWHAYIDLDRSAEADPIEVEMAELRTEIGKASSKAVAVALQEKLELLSHAPKTGRSKQTTLYGRAKTGDTKAMAQLLYLRRRNEYEEFTMEILQHVNGAGNLVGPRVAPQEPAAAPVIPATVMPAECEVSA